MQKMQKFATLEVHQLLMMSPRPPASLLTLEAGGQLLPSNLTFNDEFGIVISVSKPTARSKSALEAF